MHVNIKAFAGGAGPELLKPQAITWLKNPFAVTGLLSYKEPDELNKTDNI